MYFVTGGTGFLGGRLCRTLLNQGESIGVLARSATTINGTLEGNSNCQIIRGDICDHAVMEKGMAAAKYCFHLAAMAKIWSRKSDEFYRVNVDGTRNVLEAAVSSGIEKLVFVSTAGIYGPSVNESDIVDENGQFKSGIKTHYERSKFEAEKIVKEFAEAGKLDATIVNPTRIFGPGALNESNVITSILSRIIKQDAQYLPASNAVGNYVFVDDVVNGMIAAMKNGRAGRNYILGGDNLGWSDLLRLMHTVVQKPNKIRMVPLALVKAGAKLSELGGFVFNWSPKITLELIRKYSANYYVTSARAKNELGYCPVPVAQGISQTAKWIRQY